MVKDKEAAQKFLVENNPSTQLKICKNPDKCVCGEYPTLAGVGDEYGINVAISWLIPQLDNLASFCGSREKLEKEQERELAYIIFDSYYFLKVSELMLFFYWFKLGRYGRFYGSVDPLIITASLSEFVKERNAMIERQEQQQRKKELEEEMKGAITYDEYCRRKKVEPNERVLQILNK